jgi:hypothetical protein
MQNTAFSYIDIRSQGVIKLRPPSRSDGSTPEEAAGRRNEGRRRRDHRLFSDPPTEQIRQPPVYIE